MGSRGRGRERSATIRVDPALRPIHPLLAPLTTLEPYLADNSSFACSKLSATWRRRGEVLERDANAKNSFREPGRITRIHNLVHVCIIERKDIFFFHLVFTFRVKCII